MKTLFVIFLWFTLSNNYEQQTIKKPIPISYSLNYIGIDRTLKVKKITRKESFEYTYSIISKVVIPYKNNYLLPDSTLIRCIQTISISEGSNSKGYPYKSPLFKQLNNPYGIKGKGKSFTTVEYYNGERTIINDNFAKFENLYDATSYLMQLLENKRYDKLHNVTTAEDFFMELESSGYYTAPNYWKVLLFIYNQR